MRNIALSLLVFFLPSSVGAAGLRSGNAVFVDVPQDTWFAGYVHDAEEKRIVSGYKDKQGNPTGKFGPANSVTVAEIVKISMIAAGYDISLFSSEDRSCPLGIGHWAESYVCVAATLSRSGIRVTYGPGLNKDSAETRAKGVALIAQFFNVARNGKIGDRYTDVTGNNYLSIAIETLSRDGVVSGDTDAQGHSLARFRPNDPISRAEVVKIVMKARETYGQPALDGKNATEKDIPEPIQKLCRQGHVDHMQDQKTGQALYSLRNEAPSLGGTIVYYDENGKMAGRENYSDVPSFKLDDGTITFCSFEGKDCPAFVRQTC